jgi:hypothetical protein
MGFPSRVKEIYLVLRSLPQRRMYFAKTRKKSKEYIEKYRQTRAVERDEAKDLYC